MVPLGKPRTVPLFNPYSHPQSWNERMGDGEFAVLYAGAAVPPPPSPGDIPAGAPYCVLFDSLTDAEQFSAQEVALYPSVRCRIYDHNRLANDPLGGFTGKQFKTERNLSPRLRRWIGGILLFGGGLLFLVDWLADFRYGWPSMVGTRMAPTGLVLLFIDAGIMLNRAQQRRKEQKS